jgi:hypothetical protein
LQPGVRDARQRWEAIKTECTLRSSAYVKGARAAAGQQRRQLQPLRRQLRAQGKRTRWAKAQLQQRVRDTQGRWSWQVVSYPEAPADSEVEEGQVTGDGQEAAGGDAVAAGAELRLSFLMAVNPQRNQGTVEMAVEHVAREANAGWLPMLRAWRAVETKRVRGRLRPLMDRLEGKGAD